MIVQFPALLRIAAIAILITLLWSAMIAYTCWDLYRQRTRGGTAFFWLILVALLPLVSFLLYLSFRAGAAFHRPRTARIDPNSVRETALQRPPAKKDPLPTLLASDLTAETVFDPQRGIDARAEPKDQPKRYVFTITVGTNQGRKFLVDQFPATIGRGGQATIQLNGDLGVSRKHAEIYAREGVVRICDLKSLHGTRVNGVRIEDEILKPGDPIQVGLTVLVMDVIEG